MRETNWIILGRCEDPKKVKARCAWFLMRYRCLTPTSPDYENYGARGIKICDRWQDVTNFFEDMGPVPFPKATIDRIDVNGHYCKENCRWLSIAEQARNKRNTIWLDIGGKRFCLSEAARKFSLGESTLRERLKRGWKTDRALTTPPETKFLRNQKGQFQNVRY